MYDYLKGKLVFFGQNKITLEVNGIGYSLLVPFNVFSRLPKTGSDVLFFTTLVVKEDAHILFGFLERKEKELFETLIALSGIGPKTALNIIGHINYDHFFLALSKGDVKALAKIPGLGKKSAERLFLEMRGKYKNLTEIDLGSKPIEQGPSYDAISALMNLGYSAKNAQQAVAKALESLEKAKKAKELKDPGKIIALALKKT